MLNVNRILPRTSVEGPGERFCLWLQGCSRHCPGCFATDTWSHDPRNLTSPEDLAARVLEVDGIEGITILGGEPFEQSQELAAFLDLIPNQLSVILFTGNRLSEMNLQDPTLSRILSRTDVLIDGEYREEERSFSRPMVGSSNQNFYFLTDRYQITDFPPNRIEVRISQDGTAQFNGMGDFERLKYHEL